MEMKTEADSNDITDCPNDDKPYTGMTIILDQFSPNCHIVLHIPLIQLL